MLKMSTILPGSAAVLSVMAISLPASASLVIENGDTVTPAWSVSGDVTSVARPSGSGNPGNGLQINYTVVNGWGTGTISTTSIAGDLSSYRGGSLDFSYRILGVEDSSGQWQLTANHPYFTSIAIVDTGGRSINWDVNVSSDALGWDVSNTWHTVSLYLPEQASDMGGNRDKSHFDGVAGTSSSLPTSAAGLGFGDPNAEWNGFWQNIARIDIITHASGTAGTAGKNAAVVLDNVTLVPEPTALGLLGAVSLIALRRRRGS